jgi:aryl-alcohol dehydrogenase-like predicted oxidoreductase
MNRRDFIIGAAYGAGTALLTRDSFSQSIRLPATSKFSASDTVEIGKTGIKTSRLAMGTGTVGFGGRSNQTALGSKELVNLLLNGYDNGLRLFDTSDSYGSHPHIAGALKHVPRDKVTVMTKTDTRDAAGVRADLDRYRRELGTDYIDIVLLHCLTEGDWTERYRGAMDVLSEAREKGIIRAHGCSCHTIEALRAAARSPWVQVDLARINPIGSHMDANPSTVTSVLREMRAVGKGIIGMKILGQGDMRNRPDEALHYALSLDVLDAFTIGAENKRSRTTSSAELLPYSDRPLLPVSSYLGVANAREGTRRLIASDNPRHDNDHL